MATWAIVVEPDRLVVERVDVPVRGWPAALDGLRVAAIADVHAGAPHVDAAKLAELVRITNAEQADLVVLLGDYVIHGVPGGRFVPPEDTARALSALLGNHDWWYDGQRVRRAFESAGIPVLENEAHRLDLRGQPLWLLGLADMWTRRVDVEAPLRTVPAADPVMALTHNPDVFPSLPARVLLTLAGHTHGGQVSLPIFGRPIVPSRYGQRYAAGLVEEGGRSLFVTQGVGTSIMPVRLGVPPSVSVLTVRAQRR
jgi:predicted MPP superfamily phosphohydrolase